MSVGIRQADHNLYIPKTIITNLRDYAIRSPDREVCGLLTGSFSTAIVVDQFHSITNISKNELGYDDYMMDPQESMDVLKHTQIIPNNKNWKYDLVGIFHSHPHGTPWPSSIDIKTAAYNVVYIIYSVVYNKFSFQYWDGEWFIPLREIGILES